MYRHAEQGRGSRRSLRRCLLWSLGSLFVSCICITFFVLGRHFPVSYVNDPIYGFSRQWDAHTPSNGLSGGIATSTTRHLEPFYTAYGRTRHGVYIATDKAAYRPGDTLYARVTVLNVLDRTASEYSYLTGPNNYDIVGPKGDIVHTDWLEPYTYFPNTGPIDMAGGNGIRWKIPKSLPGGDYILKTKAELGFVPAERSFQVKSYRATRLKLQATMEQDSYTYGDTAYATVYIHRAHGGVPVGADVSVTARIDGQEVYRSKPGTVKVPITGEVRASALLPLSWDRGEGTLTVTVQDEGVVESTSVTLPLVTSSLDISVYPEGGDLVYGLPSRVYVSASLPTNEPALLIGDVCETDTDVCVAHVETIHEGRGVSSVFTPGAGKSYDLVVRAPVKQRVHIDVGRKEGATLRALNNTYSAGAPVSFSVSSTTARPLRLGLYRKEVEVSSMHITGSGVVTLTPAQTGTAEGVLRATLMDLRTGEYLAERLVYREPAHSLSLDVQTAVNGTEVADTKDQVYAPGDTITVTVTAFHDDGTRAAGALLGITVTDSRSLLQVSRRYAPPRLPCMVLLESEVITFTDPSSYFTQHKIGDQQTGVRVDPKEAVDLLLGTQGWRRFAFKDPLSWAKKEEIPDVKEKHEDIPEEKRLRVLGIGAKLPESDDQPVMFMARGAAMNVMMAAEAPPDVNMHMEKAQIMHLDVQEDERIPGMAGWDAGDRLEYVDNTPEEFVFAEDERIPGMAGWEAASRIEVETDNHDFTFAQDERIPGLAGWEQDISASSTAATAGSNPDNPEAVKLNKMAAEGFAQGDKWENPNMNVMQPDELPGGGGYGSFWEPPQLDMWQQTRVYAHQNNKNSPEENAVDSSLRQDTNETVLFVAVTKTDKEGVARFTFDLSDSVTTYVVQADGYTRMGELGIGDGEFSAVKPLFIEAKIPTQVVAGDVIEVPITTTVTDIVSRGLKGLNVHLQVSASIHNKAQNTHEKSVKEGVLEVYSDHAAYKDWSAGENNTYTTTVRQTASSNRLYLPMTATTGSGEDVTAEIRLTSSITGGSRLVGQKDSVSQSLVILPSGFPIKSSQGGTLEAKSPATIKVDLPADAIPGTISAYIHMYPTPIASLTRAIERLIQEPCGCFEQTSATTYPMVMALKYLEGHSEEGTDQLKEKARRHLEKGLKTLLTYESSDGGFEWFGRSPGHEALTAYGLLQFIDMSKVIHIPQDIVDRTVSWIVTRRDGKGGFNTSKDALDSFGYAPKDLTDAYILYSLVSAGIEYEGRDKDIQALKTRVTSIGYANDPYELGLVSALLYSAGGEHKNDAYAMAKRLTQVQAEDGSVGGAATSITNSKGESLLVETTAISVLAWLNDDSAFTQNTELAIRWLASACEDGRYASTQGTVLSLKAIIRYENSRVNKLAPAMVTLTITPDDVSSKENNFPLELSVELSSELVSASSSGQPLTFDGEKIKEFIQPGHAYTMTLEKRLLNAKDVDTGLPYSSLITWQSPLPQTSENAFVHMSITSQKQVFEGETVDVTVKVANQSTEKTGMVVCVIGVPGGIQVRHESLTQLKRSGKIASFEVINGQDVYIYWDGVAAGGQKQVAFDGTATIPGHFTGRASRAYEYYNDQHKHWIEPLSLDIKRRE